MSAGGAVMAPTSRAMQITPLAAHTLTARPIIVSEDDTIMIRAHASQRNNTVELTTDGHDTLQRYVYVHDDPPYVDTTISRHRFVNIWRPAGWNFFEVLNEKMSWGN